jgi:putative transcriptional regulator
MEIPNLDIFKPNNNLEIKKGRLLISEPLSLDYFFNRTIVFVTEYNENGAFGFILNRMSEYRLSDVFNANFLFNPKLNIGGPVGNDTLNFIHTIDYVDGIEVVPDIYWGGNFDEIKLLAKEGKINDKDIRFFIGYSGWASNQLKQEIYRNYWQIINYDKNIIMNLKTESDWEQTLKQFGNKYKYWANTPKNPTLN